ncbi:hypothetical protein [Methylobacterium nigriterrae]|uniref:hypothetical protein n=1 Tax=Methylobacterium nigriterrae TaxID=3127512 RepID=UPI003013FA5D
MTALGLLLVLAMPASAKPRPHPDERPPGTVDPAGPRLRAVEQRSRDAEREQQARDRRFDARVRRATGSICSGC